MKIAVIFAIPVEYNTSSNLRSGSIVNELYKAGNYVCCFMPRPDTNSRYYSNATSVKCNDIIRYGKVIKSAVSRKTSKDKVALFGRLKRWLLTLLRRVDVFGSALLYLPYRKEISKRISEGGFDVLITFSDPMVAHMIGNYCKRRNRKLRYIQQWGDPLANDRVVRTSQPFWFQEIIERALIKHADKICYVSPITLKEQQELFHEQADRMVFIPTPSLDYGISCKEEHTAGFIEKKCISLGYFGSYNSVARNIQPFYDAAREIHEAHFVIIGDSDVDLESLDNIEILNRVPHEQLRQYIMQTDVIVCLLNKAGNQIPGKLYHDASLPQDILVITDGEYGESIIDYFARYGHYTFVNNDKEEIKKVIYNYIEAGVPKRERVLDFSPEYIAKKLLM